MPWERRLEVLRTLWLLKKNDAGFDWLGIYRLDNQSEGLVVSCYWGEATDHTHIPLDRGICGAAIREDKTLNIPQVRADPRFIACSIKTQSELVVPIRNSQGIAVAEIDIDSNQVDYFSAEKVAAVEACAQKLSPLFETN
jgi:GAF domain-containing protein